MDLGLQTLMGASGLGGGLGIAVKLGSMFFQARAERRRQKEERKAKRELAYSQNGLEFQKALNDQPQTVETDNETKFNFKIWKIDFNFQWSSKGTDLAKNQARASRSSVIFMCALTLCLSILIFADNGLYPVWTTPANAEPITTEYFWGAYSKTKPPTEVQVLSGMGVAFLLCHGILSLITYWAVQAPINYITGRR